MPTYMVLGTYNAQGRAGLIAEGGTGRYEETKALFEGQLGGTIHYYAFLQGSYDFVLIVELADEETFLAPLMVATAGGAFTAVTSRVISPQEFDLIAGKARDLQFRSSGE